MTLDQVKCPICGYLSTRSLVPGFDLPFFECITCGRYSISHNYISNIDKDIFASYLYYNLLLSPHADDEKNIFYFIGSETTFIKLSNQYPDSRLLRMEEVENWYPKNFNERIDLILLGLAQLSDYIGKSIPLIGSTANSLLFIKRFIGNNELSKEKIEEQLMYITSFMSAQELIKQEYSNVVLLPEGLKRIDELQKNHSVSKQAFIAMQFSESSKNIREAIRNGVEMAGYKAHFIDEKEHNNQIVPEILYEIKKSKFTIAELTGHNNGAYYEAGYAAGLGKEVIHICNKKTFEQDGHFDVKQKATILWENENEIVEALYKRIEATVGLINTRK